MIITCISECTKKAFPRSQRVLSKYLPQIGRRTWQGPLSEEGLANLIDELKQDVRTRHRKTSVGKNTSVAIYRNVGTKASRLLSVVGSKRSFSPEGHYCFSVRQVQQQSYAPLSRWNRLLLTVLRLAALFHDLGKVTEGFRTKLGDGSNQPDAIRHEVISWLLLVPLLRDSEKHDLGDHNWLAMLDQPEKVEAYFSEQAGKLAALWSQKGLIKRLQQQSTESAPLLNGIAFLVLSHHRLPDPVMSTRSNGGLGFDPKYNASDCHAWMYRPDREAKPFLTISTDHPALPWKQEAWQKAVADQVEKLKQLRHSGDNPPRPLLPGYGCKDPIDSAIDWMGMLLHHLRPLLVASDYLGSQAKQPYRPQQKGFNRFSAKEQIFANTLDGQPADSLTDHLLKVARWTRRLYLDIEHWSDQLPAWQRLSSAELPTALSPLRLENNLEQGIKSRIRISDTRFRWQPELQQQLVAERLRLQKHRPNHHLGFFGVMLAETGAGKTRAAITALCAATGGARLTTALGYRSLTVQTSEVYQRELGLKPHQVSTLIGVSLEREQLKTDVADGNKAETDEPDSSAGCPESPPEFSWQHQPVDNSDGHPLTTLGTASFTPMLETAVVVATTDHLAHALEGDRGAKLLPMFRIATSDTLFDELDSYDDKDLVSLNRWAYACGYYGRALMLVSATLSPQLVESFASQYYAGLRAFKRRTSRPISILNMLASNQLSPMLFDSSPSALDRFRQRYLNEFIPALEKASLKTAAEMPRRRLGWLPIDSYDQTTPGQPLCNALEKQIGQLHSAHAATVKIDGKTKRISIGFIMWDTVERAQRACRLLDSQAPNHWRLACYHSRFTLLDRYLIEHSLSPLLKRKDEGAWQKALLANPVINQHLEQNDELVIIICTTNILETGRDFDADWAIADLLSVRSLVQLAGRVLRHRIKAVQQPNLILMTEPFDYARKLCKQDPGNLPLDPLQLQALLSMGNKERLGRLFENGIIQASPLLNQTAGSEQSPLLASAQQIQADTLKYPSRLLQRPDTWFNNHLAYHYRFRQSNPSNYLLCHEFDLPVWEQGRYQSENWYQLDKQLLHPTSEELRSSKKPIMILDDHSLTRNFVNESCRVEIWERGCVKDVNPALLHTVQADRIRSEWHYSSELGLIKPD